MLEGERVLLRAMEPADVDLLMAWENNTSNWNLSGTIAPYSRASIESFVKQSDLTIYQTGQLRLMIDLKSEQATIGTLDLFDFDVFHRRAGVGILIANEANRGQGLASESLKLLIDYAFDHLGLHQLYCSVLEDNLRSTQLFKSSGFSITGKKSHWIREGEVFKDQYFMQLLKDH